MARPAPSLTAAALSNFLAASHDGCTESLMLAHGFSIKLMVELIRAGLASATAERVVAGRRTMEVATVKITEAGRRVLAGT